MNYCIGQKAEFSKTISQTDVYNFAGICGDFNPVHVNDIMASKSIFGKAVVHGALVNAFISTVLGMYLPGPGTVYIRQDSKFVKPVYIGDTITARVEIVEMQNGNKAELQTNVYNQKGEIVLEGKAVVRLPQ